MTLEELAREAALLRAENARLRQQNTDLRERVSYLEERLGLNSDISSKPPSMNSPTRKLPSFKERGLKKRGGQKGHPDHFRELLPVEEVNILQICPPPEICSCGGHVRVTLDSPYRHQVASCRQQGRNVLDYLTSALTAFFQAITAPPLLSLCL